MTCLFFWLLFLEEIKDVLVFLEEINDVLLLFGGNQYRACFFEEINDAFFDFLLRKSMTCHVLEPITNNQ